jgi:hypothetical protein
MVIETANHTLGAEIVHHDDVIRLEGWGQDLLDISPEGSWKNLLDQRRLRLFPCPKRGFWGKS